MASTVKVPLLGQQNKGTVVGVTIAGVTVTGYLIYRKTKQSKQAAAAATAQDSVGYGLGTAQTSDYGNGYFGYGSAGSFPEGYYGYGTPLPPTTQGPLPLANGTNAQWAQAAIEQLTKDGYDPMAVAAALGAYELGQPVTPQQQSIIQAAIGVEGYPPVAGRNGDPPGINVQGTPGGGSGGGQGGGRSENGGGGGGTPPPVIHPPPPVPDSLRTVPRVTGERANVGLAKIRAAGFKTKTSPIRNPAREYTITATHPPGGTRALVRSLVIVDVQVIQPGTVPVEFSGGPVV